MITLSSLVISVFSTTMYDALCFQKPVVRIKFSEYESHEIDKSGIIVVSTLDDLYDKIINLQKNFDHTEFLKNLKQFIKEQFGLPEENPQEIIRKLIG